MQKYFEITWRLWKLLKPFHGYFYLQLFLSVSLQIASTFTTLLVSKIIDNAVLKDWHLVSIFFIIYFILLMLIRMLDFIFGRKEIQNSYGKIQQYLEEYSLEKLFKLNSSQYTENHSAIRLQIIDRGENAVQTIIETLLLQALSTILIFITSIIAIGFYSINISILYIITMTIVIYVTYKFTNYWRPKMRENIDNWDKQRKIRVEAFEHLRLIKLFGTENNYSLKYFSNRLNIVNYHVYVWILNVNFISIRDVFITVSRYTSLVMAIYYFAQGNISIGIVYAIFAWITRMYDKLGMVNNILRQLPTNYIYLEKYLDVIDMKPDFNEEGKNKFVAGDIEFKNLSFKYPKGENNVLENLSFKINHGEKVAFVGYSGSGKTTIIQLLLRAYDYNIGDIKIGNISLKEMSANSLRENIGYVEQHVDLFDDTIKNNILFGLKDEKVLEKIEKENENIDTNFENNILETLARKARIDQFYHRLGEKKFDTMIGERGIKLSGGERQRVGIARALIKNPDILIFDEATSSLDAKNETYIKEAIDEASHGRTTIIIAHRLSTIINVDKIFMMSHGKILAEGTHSELLKSCKEYKDLVEAQMSEK